MKITDTVGRSLLVDLMYKDGSRWLLAPEHKLKGRGTGYTEVPRGSEIAIKIESLLGAELLVYQNGELKASVEVEPRTQYVERDNQGFALMFGKDGATRGARRLDSKAHKPLTLAADCGSETAEATEKTGVVALPSSLPEVPKGDGLVYVVVRIRKQNDPSGEPPQEEFECAFQLLEKSAAEKHFAENIHLLVQAPKVPNPADLFDRQAMSKDMRANRLSRFCNYCNHKH
jgi:hypothetical protein